jgi:hypothetical protein
MEAPKLKSKAAKLETFRRMNIKSNAGAAYPAASVAPAVSEFPEDPIDAEVVKPDLPVIVNGKSLTKEDALTAPKYAATLRVIDQVTLDEANGYLKVIKSLAAKIGDTFDPQIAKAHDLHKSLLAEKKKFAAPLEDAEKIVKPDTWLPRRSSGRKPRPPVPRPKPRPGPQPKPPLTKPRSYKRRAKTTRPTPSSTPPPSATTRPWKPPLSFPRLRGRLASR